MPAFDCDNVSRMKQLGWRRAFYVLAICSSGCQFSTSTGSRLPTPDGGDHRGLVTTPNVVLMTQAEAEAAFRSAGFDRPPTIDNNSLCGSTVDGQIVELGRVCAQMPAAGQENSRGVPITLRLQTENPHRGELRAGGFWFLMPNLVGAPLAQARAKLREVGFEKEPRLIYVDRPGCAPDVVCETNPEGLTRTGNTSDKLLYLGRPPGKSLGIQDDDPPPEARKPEPDARRPEHDARKPEPKKPEPQKPQKPQKPEDIF